MSPQVAAHCPHCSGFLNADSRLAGQNVSCPHCGGVFVMPAPAPAIMASALPAHPLSPPPQPPPRPPLQYAGATAASYDSPTPANSSDAPQLWNPQAAGAWSLLFTWGFGAYLLSKNWQALGHGNKAKRSMIWFYSIIPFLLLALITPDTPSVNGFFRFCGLAALVAWGLLELKPQLNLIKERFGNSYSRQPWGKPLALGAGSLFGFFMLAAMASSASNHPDVALVRTGSLNAYPDIEFGDVIDSFMRNASWEAIDGDDGNHYVNVEGKVTFMGKPVIATLQMLVDRKRETFEINAFEINGVPQNGFMQMGFLAKMYEQYGN